ncbi:MAG TPA: phosphatidate cytidylyltransferase [Candidatus Acidoferrales bacterium]|jgi:phosphatidate cytidylyltransferase|nr:phosphatidate cytidylyltransferase [Candidatus Acidoferrales bacterium]
MTFTRVLTAGLLIPAVVAIVWFAPTSVVAVTAAAVMLLALLELFSLGDRVGLHGHRVWTGLCALAVFFTQWLMSAEQTFSLAGGERLTRTSDAIGSTSIEWILVVFVLGSTAIVLFGRQPVVESFGGLSVSSAAMVFLVLPLSTVIRIHGAPHIGKQLLLFTLVLVWAGDTLAYFVGRSIGRHPMAPHLSPKKTWEGGVANLAGSVIVALIAQRWLDVPLRHLVGMAVLANLAGQGGDLLESAYKRSAGMKDSGALLPGHGGMLDRIDALILAAPVVWYYFYWLSTSR